MLPHVQSDDCNKMHSCVLWHVNSRWDVSFNAVLNGDARVWLWSGRCTSTLLSNHVCSWARLKSDQPKRRKKLWKRDRKVGVTADCSVRLVVDFRSEWKKLLQDQRWLAAISVQSVLSNNLNKQIKLQQSEQRSKCMKFMIQTGHEPPACAWRQYQDAHVIMSRLSRRHGYVFNRHSYYWRLLHGVCCVRAYFYHKLISVSTFCVETPEAGGLLQSGIFERENLPWMLQKERWPSSQETSEN